MTTCAEYVWLRARVLRDCVTGDPLEPVYFETLAQPVPEPATWVALVVAVVALLALKWSR